MSEHPQAAILRAIAEDKDATIQFRAPGAVEWGVCGVAYMLMHPAFIYRIAPKPDADGWIPWHGGENPVPGKWVEYRCDGNSWSVGPVESESLYWDHKMLYGDITAYRVVKPKLEKVYYLWARKALGDSTKLEYSLHLSEADDPPFPGAIRLD